MPISITFNNVLEKYIIKPLIMYVPTLFSEVEELFLWIFFPPTSQLLVCKQE